jgi:membrane-associated protein
MLTSGSVLYPDAPARRIVGAGVWPPVSSRCQLGTPGLRPEDGLSCASVSSALTLALSLDPKTILSDLSPYGEIGLILMIFAETGLLFGFFLPGDSLLFTAGLLAQQGKLNLAAVLIGCFAAAVIGDQVGFTIGDKAGPRMFRKPDSRLFKHEYIERTDKFFEKHGPKTVVMARFVPVVRTFAPVMAGVGSMSRRTFIAYNVVGAFIWVFGVTLAGYFLADAIGDSVDKYLLPIIALIILLSLIPPFLEWRKARRESHTVTAEEAQREADALHAALEDD